ncbi:MAG: aldo/keto reductase [Planctomycetes bacterium]|nr:aldo/keto reductase [Planctomycetota bacterium]
MAFGPLGKICRLGLAAHMRGKLHEDDVHHAIDRGVTFLNWFGADDYLGRAIANLGSKRRDVFVCVQFEARTAADAERELDQLLRGLRTDYLDVVTFYYVEAEAERQQITGPGGALEFCRRAQEQGKIRMLGVTSHQRPLAAEIARSGLVDMLMIRYNAAHRGAEREIFPTTTALNMPVVAYTCLRWGALLELTIADPPGLVLPTALDCYRFVLQNPAATVALTAPCTRAELDENLRLLDDWRGLSEEEYQRLIEHGRRVRQHAGAFP